LFVQIATTRPRENSCGGTLLARYGTRRCIRCTCNWTTVLPSTIWSRVAWLCLSPSWS
jgi:hypothetical protein